MTARRDRILPAARPLSLGGLTVLLLSPGLWLGASLDAAVFVLVGARLRGGEMPYRDVWDHKPPGVYVAEWVGQSAVPWLAPWLVAWLLSAVCSVAAVLILYALMARRFSPAAAWGWGVAGAVGVACYPIALGGGLTETFALAPLMAAWWLAIAGRPTGRTLVSAGALLAVACLMSLQAAMPGAAIAAGAVARDRQWRDTARRACLVAAGGVVPVALAVGWLIGGSAAGDAFDQIVVYNAAYRAGASSPAEVWLIVALMLAGLLIPAAAGALRVARGRPGTGLVDVSALLWVVAGGAFIAYQGRVYLHYLVLVVPPLAVLAASGLEGAAATVRARASARGARLRATGVATATGTALLLSAMVTAQVTAVVVDRGGRDSAASGAAASWLRANTCPSAKVFVWGNDATIYLDSGRDPHGRYVYLFPMVTEDYWTAGRTAEMLQRWQADPPQVIVEGPSAVPLFRSPAANRDPRDFDTLEPLRAFVGDNYRLAASFGEGEFFRDVYVLQADGR